MITFIDLLKPNSTESLNRRSWDSSKLETQIEEEPVEFHLEVSKSDVKLNKTPEPIKKDTRDGMLSKFRNFKKGRLFI